MTCDPYAPSHPPPLAASLPPGGQLGRGVDHRRDLEREQRVNGARRWRHPGWCVRAGPDRRRSETPLPSRWTTPASSAACSITHASAGSRARTASRTRCASGPRRRPHHRPMDVRRRCHRDDVDPGRGPALQARWSSAERRRAARGPRLWPRHVQPVLRLRCPPRRIGTQVGQHPKTGADHYAVHDSAEAFSLARVSAMPCWVTGFTPSRYSATSIPGTKPVMNAS